MKEEEQRILQEETKKQERLKAKITALEQTQLNIGRKNDEEERNLSDDQIRALQKQKSESLKNLQEEKQSLINALSKTPEQRTAERLAEMERERAQNNKAKDKVAEGAAPTTQPSNAVAKALEELKILRQLENEHPILAGEGKIKKALRVVAWAACVIVGTLITKTAFKTAAKIDQLDKLTSEKFLLFHTITSEFTKLQPSTKVQSNTVEKTQKVSNIKEPNKPGERVADISTQSTEIAPSDRSKTPTPATGPRKSKIPVRKNINTGKRA